jgi:hypothetical protein
MMDRRASALVRLAFGGAQLYLLQLVQHVSSYFLSNANTASSQKGLNMVLYF